MLPEVDAHWWQSDCPATPSKEETSQQSSAHVELPLQGLDASRGAGVFPKTVPHKKLAYCIPVFSSDAAQAILILEEGKSLLSGHADLQNVRIQSRVALASGVSTRYLWYWKQLNPAISSHTVSQWSQATNPGTLRCKG